MTAPQQHGIPRRIGRGLLLQAALVVATLGAIELLLVLTQPRYLFPERTYVSTFGFRYDSELGWSLTPGADSGVIQNNSLGMRETEPTGSRPAVLFIGDSLVWGYPVATAERFTERLKPQFPEHEILNAGVVGYGTDQQYLLLQRLWGRLKPVLVVLTFCEMNDRLDNSSNLRQGYYKPYLREASAGVWTFGGQPVPRPRHDFVTESRMRHLMLGRLAMSAYVEVRHRRVTVPDPTERLVGMIRDFVHERGARLLVGMQFPDQRLAAFMTSEGIPFVDLEGGSDLYDHTRHWTPKGHAHVADRYAGFLAAHGVARAVPNGLNGSER